MEERFEAFVGLITQIYKSIQRIKGLEMTEQGLRGNHTMCLYNLGRHPDGLTCAQLTILCEEDKAAISRTLAELETQGYVRREAPAGSGKYRAKLLLTEKGQAAARFIRQRAESIVGQGGEGLTDNQREILYASLSLISQNLQSLPGEND
ncbi:MAG: MarR family transcriptional regulator [Candidatus Pelethousia sp.]|nr:MarR family transcriptional regulator [Candidatus Pelethousia sp.]